MLKMIGDKYSKLTVLEYTKTNPKNGMRHFLCKCDCGNKVEVALGNLRSGHTKSCGCAMNKGEEHYAYKHGFKITDKVYKSWCKIRERCYNPNDKSYYSYGAVGVKMSDTFYSDFMNFYKEVGEPPENTKEWSIDRIDHTKGYEEGNLRWANNFQQARNKGKTRANKSGVTGVHWENKVSEKYNSSITYAVSQWQEYDSSGKRVNGKKSFSTTKYGLLPAFAEAVKYREAQISRLNEMGYDYAENHGQ